MVRSCGLCLSHGHLSYILQPRVSYHNCAIRKTNISYSVGQTSNMGSTEQWPAIKVRNTFIQFFEKNGHKFGTSKFLIQSIL